jgi:hypothetical protein
MVVSFKVNRIEIGLFLYLIELSFLKHFISYKAFISSNPQFKKKEKSIKKQSLLILSLRISA